MASGMSWLSLQRIRGHWGTALSLQGDWLGPAAGGFVLIVLAVTAGAAVGFSLVLGSYAVAVAVFLFVLIFGACGPVPQERYRNALLATFFAYLFFSIVWPRYAFFRPPGLPGLSLTRAFQAAALLMWIYLLLRSRAYRSCLRDRLVAIRGVVVGSALFLIVKVLGVLVADHPLIVLKDIANELLSVAFPFLLMLTVVSDRKQLRAILGVFFAAALVVIAIGAYEGFVGRNLFFGLLDVDSEYLRQVFYDKDRGAGHRVQSTFSNPLTLSEFLSFSFPVCAYFLLNLRRRAIGGLVLIGYAIAAMYVVKLSGSRSGLGALGLAFFGVAIFYSVRGLMVSKTIFGASMNAMAVGLCVCAAIIASMYVSDLLLGNNLREFQSGMARIEMWRKGLSEIVDSPLIGFGQGLGAIALEYRGGNTLYTIDSYFLSVLLDNGVAGLLCLIFVLSYTLYVAFSSVLRKLVENPLLPFLGLSVLLFSIVKIVLSLTHNHGLMAIVVAMVFILDGFNAEGAQRPDDEYRGVT